MSVKIRLHQEGFVRTTGYQTVQRINRLPAGVTDPLTYAEIFAIRQVLGREALDHITTPLEMVQLPINELKYFEAVGPGGELLPNALPGDTLNVLTVIPHWIQSAAPYLDQSFSVDAVTLLASGTTPQLLPGGTLVLPGYRFTDRDVGRWVSLSGFTTPSYNVRVRITSYEATTARVALTVSSPEIGAAWDIRRLRIVTNVNPALERRYFPTLAGPVNWEVRRGPTTIIASGAEGFTMRELPAAEMFRDHTVTSLVGTASDADDLLTVTRRNVEALQQSGDQLDTAFLAPANYDYPPT